MYVLYNIKGLLLLYKTVLFCHQNENQSAINGYMNFDGYYNIVEPSSLDNRITYKHI